MSLGGLNLAYALLPSRKTNTNLARENHSTHSAQWKLLKAPIAAQNPGFFPDYRSYCAFLQPNLGIARLLR